MIWSFQYKVLLLKALLLLPLFINLTEAFSQTSEIPSFRPRRGQFGVNTPGKSFSITHIQRPSATELHVAQFDAPFMNSAVNFINEEVSFTSSILMSNHHVSDVTNIPLIDGILSNPTFWSISIMLSIVSLLLAWEESIHTIRQKIPPALGPVIDSMLGEISGLGFIGLFLEVFVTGNPGRGLGGVLGDLSGTFLGEEGILLEAFESLHSAFFEVGVGFFFVTGVIVYAVLVRINELSNISALALDTNGDGEVSLEELADTLNADAIIVDTDGDGLLSDEEITYALRKTKMRGFLEEVSLTVEERASEILLVRQQFLSQHNLKDSFLIEKYFEEIFAHNLEEMVELSPLTWLPLIPLISLLDSIDLSRDIVNASSANAALSSGCFITSPWFAIPSVLSQLFGIVWCIINYWKMKKIKNMLIPTLVRDGQGGAATLLPPRYKDDDLRLTLNTSPGPIAFIEQLSGGKSPTNKHEYLFGVSGKEGPEVYRNSIKFRTWLCVAQIVFSLVR